MLNLPGPGRVNVYVALLIFAFTTLAASADERIVYGISSRIAALDPYTISGIDSYRTLGFIVEPLARTEPFSQDLKPVLAESWSIDPKKKIITVKLRKNVKFTNGEPLTAEDVKFTWSSYNNPDYKGAGWRGMWSEVADVKAIDATTVEFHLKEAKFQIFQNVMTTLRILPKSYYGKLNPSAWSTNAIGSGPFKVERFESNQTLYLAVNHDWWGWTNMKRPTPRALAVKNIPDTKFAEQAILKKELDIYEVPSGVAPPPNTKWLPSPFGVGISIAFNFRRKELQNLELRKALVMMWNRKALSEKVFGARLTPALDSFSATTKYYPRGIPLPYDQKQAAQIIKKLGYTPEIPLTLKILGGQAGSERWISLFQADAAKVGVKIELENVSDENQWWQLAQQGKSDLVAYDGPFSESPHPSVWHSKSAYNFSGLKDEKLDKMVEQLDREFDSKKRHALQAEIIRYLRSITVEIPGLATTKAPFLLSPAVTVDDRAPLEPWRWRKKVRQ
jgi:peptide/nickel transport system substrate-binding protein